MTTRPTRIAIVSTRVPRSAASYSAGLTIGDISQVSGQGPLDPATGEVLHPGDVAGQTRLTLEHVAAVLADGGASFADVLMVRVYLANRADFAAMNAAYDAFLRDALGPLDPPARTTLIVGLPLEDMLVEIDVLAVRSLTPAMTAP